MSEHKREIYRTNINFLNEKGTGKLSRREADIVEKYCMRGGSVMEVANIIYGKTDESALLMAFSYIQGLVKKGFLSKVERSRNLEK